MKKHTSSGAIIYTGKGVDRKFLVMYREKTASWHLPKGTQNLGESLEETAIRESKEETGFDIKIQKYVGKLESSFQRDNKKISKETHYFLAEPLEKVNLFPHDAEHDEIYFQSYKTSLTNLQNLSQYEKEGEILKIANELLNKK